MSGIVYHYTIAGALLNMVEVGKVCLRVNHCDLLNNPTERLYVMGNA